MAEFFELLLPLGVTFLPQLEDVLPQCGLFMLCPLHSRVNLFRTSLPPLAWCVNSTVGTLFFQLSLGILQASFPDMVSDGAAK